MHRFDRTAGTISSGGRSTFRPLAGGDIGARVSVREEGFSIVVRRRHAVALAAAAMLLSLAATPVAAAPSGRATLAGSVPAWATSANFKSAANTKATVSFRVYLGWRNESAAAALAAAVSDPGGAQYGKYLTPAQFRQRFAPSRSSVVAVQSWLKRQGFRVDYTPTNNHYVAAEGTVAQAAAAFGVKFNDYKVQGFVVRAPSKALSIPTSLASTVVSVLGLDDSAVFIHTDHIVADGPAPGGFRNGRPCSSYWAEDTTANTTTLDGTVVPDVYGSPQPYAPCGYTPAQLRGAYGATASGLSGAGVTVAVIDAYASPTMASDLATYISRNDPSNPLRPGQFTQVVAPGTVKRPNNPAQDPSGWSSEETLDLEAVHSMAPAAKLVYVGAPNNYQDLDAALNHVVDRHLADIVTNSYGFSGEAVPPGFIKPYNDTFMQAAIEGISVLFSSGDYGDETGGNPANAASATPDWPASSPWVTAVGGTSLGVDSNNATVLETGWESGSSTLKNGTWSPAAPGTYVYGSGGGTSRLFAQPSWQAGVVPSSMATASGARPKSMRTVPDVAALGDPNTGMLIGQTQTFPDGTYYDEYRIGGTSLSSPLFAGMLALAEQNAGHPLGFANPDLYAAAGSAAYNDIQHVDQAGVIRVNDLNGYDGAAGYGYLFRSFDFTSGLTIHTVAGYDEVTGLGTPTTSFYAAVGN
jgi:subtilase family serine protease